MTVDEANYLIERLKVLCADMTELLNQATEELSRIEQTFDKPPKCLGCLYSDLDKAFHPCASCVDFGKYVGEVSGKTEPRKTADYCDICNHEKCENCVADSRNDYCVPSNFEQTEPSTEVETMSCAECKHKPIGAEICEEPCHYEPSTDCGWK